MQTGIKRLGNILPTSTRDNPNQGRVYDTKGIAPAITSGGGTVPCIIINADSIENNIINRIVCEERSDEGIRFFKDGCCGTLRTIDGCGDKRVIEQIIVASRGRNPSNPSDRTTGAPTEQRLEPNSQGICNTITSVAKDNYVLEISVDEDKFCDMPVRENGIRQENKKNV